MNAKQCKRLRRMLREDPSWNAKDYRAAYRQEKRYLTSNRLVILLADSAQPHGELFYAQRNHLNPRAQ